jgi:hypothetical protein
MKVILKNSMEAVLTALCVFAFLVGIEWIMHYFFGHSSWEERACDSLLYKIFGIQFNF